ncbi:MAG: efflux RND transporter periplasmic adaptor subunit [Alphaproteobacteria bacterium]|nr:efflux RND transporter periplasmic adaptor subunit [Alphaproteobacteria bacterium]
MKVGRIKVSNVVLHTFMMGLCFGVGWELKEKLTPKSDMSWAFQTPYVVTAQVETKTIAPEKKYIASVEAINGVDVKAQVTGYLDKILFTEGAYVRKGDVLFVIEQSKYIEAVNSAEADVARISADYKRVSNDHKRNMVLYKQEVLTASEIEASESELQQTRAALKAAQAGLEVAKINLGYTEVKSPINGYIGKALITKGNFVDMSGKAMARIVQISPIRVSFSISDRDRLEAIKNMKNNKIDIKKNFKVRLPDNEIMPFNVIDVFFDSEINAATATVASYLDVENPDKLLLPGNHVDAILVVGENKDYLLIPQGAIVQDELGVFVYRVDTKENGKKVAVKAYIKTGEQIDDKIIVTEGLNPSDKIIVQGLQKVDNGVEVNTSDLVK